MTQAQIIVYGAYWCPDCRRSKTFLGEHQIPYQCIEAYAHERIDTPRGRFFHTNWTGHGGATASSTYEV